MPLLHKVRPQHLCRGDLVVVCSPHYYETLLVLGEYMGRSKSGTSLKVDELWGMFVDAYPHCVQCHSCKKHHRHPALHPPRKILGVVSGKLAHQDRYVVSDFLRQVANRYCSWLCEQQTSPTVILIIRDIMD